MEIKSCTHEQQCFWVDTHGKTMEVKPVFRMILLC
jgi:hypothetical protein